MFGEAGDDQLFGDDGADDLFGGDGSDKEVSVVGTEDKVMVSGWYSDSDHHVEVLKLTDGQRLLDSQVQSLVQAMAAFAPPPAGQTTLPPSYSSLETVIAANWQ